MNLANTCHLLKPDSQIIPRLCEAAYKGRTAGGGARSTRRGGGVTSPGVSLMQLCFPVPVLFISASLIVSDSWSEHKILLFPLLGPLSKFLSPLASRPGY